MVRVLAVCGSLQERSANQASLDVVTASIIGTGSVVDEFDGLAEIPAFAADEVDAPIASVDQWRRRVDAADVVLMAAPEYAGGIAGALKNALDWLVGSGTLYRKPVVIISAGTTGGVHARTQLAQTLTWQGAYVIAELGISMPRTKSDENGRLVDAMTIESLSSLAETLLAVPAMQAVELVAAATRIAEELGVDTAHIAPAA